MVTLHEQEDDKAIKNSYAKTDTLDNLMKDQLRYFQLENELQERKYAGEDIPEEEKKNLNKKKEG